VNDGYRALLIKEGDRVQIRSRNDKDLTRMYLRLAAAAQTLNAPKVVLDGEIVALDAQGRPSFQTLQHRSSNPTHPIVFYAFDVLHVKGRDVTAEPLTKRRGRLPAILGKNTTVRLSQALPGRAKTVVAAGLEGVIAKRKASLYQPRGALERLGEIEARTPAVCHRRISTRWANGVDAVLVGYHEGKSLRFAGKARAGLIPTFAVS
jgi:bifunctional non-homologous end joining protein LigD